MVITVLGNYAQGNYAEGSYILRNYAQTVITSNEIKLFKAKSSDILRLLFEEVRMFVVWLGRFVPFAK